MCDMLACGVCVHTHTQVGVKGEDWATLQAKAEVERKTRVEARAAQLKALASLPNRMKLHELVCVCVYAVELLMTSRWRTTDIHKSRDRCAAVCVRGGGPDAVACMGGLSTGEAGGHLEQGVLLLQGGPP
jgi:hypothetical protein